MTNINWLHLSDLHQGLNSQDWLWTNVESAFFADLEKIYDRCGPWHILFFTGDLAQKGAAKEYVRLNVTLGRLYEHLKKLGSNPLLVAVPGNHDLIRPKPNSPAVKVLKNWIADHELQEEFWRDSNSLYRRQVKKSFQPFESWSRSHVFPKPTIVTEGMLPGDFAATVQHDGLKIGVIGLNITFLQLTNESYEKKLAASSRQLTALCGEHYDDWFKAHHCSFLLTHQPPSWLDHDSRSDFESEVYRPGRFVAHLYGHMHEQKVYAESRGGARVRHFWQAPSIFGLEFFGERQVRQHGYTAGRLEIEGETAKIHVWPRIAVRHQAGHLHIVPDHSASLRSDESEDVGSVLLNKKPSLESNQKKALFSVLLLATDTDLAGTRESIALHLTKSLGVSVTSSAGDTSIDPATFDQVILIQGWWWDQGKAARVWQRTSESKRIAFIVGEDSEWPPRKLTELDATEDVKSFRSTLKTPIQFNDPKQLPERVGESVTKLLQNKSGDELLGLREWERSYMDFRLPAWRSGRTATPGHLLEAENTEELYQADLYVTLDGVSQNWQRGPDGRPKPVAKNKRKKSAEIAAETAEPRVPLGEWLSVPQLKRIALVGAPGGGKTIFLTRTAAAVANACLGRPGELEPDIDLDCLRHQSGILPIPVVLEATRIATGENLTIDALIQAMSEEMSASGKSRPRANELKQGLKSGRYLLLIDALDEIADPAQRTAVLDLLKGLAAQEVFPNTRVVLTTRSARYTGSLKFGPELEIVEVAPLSDTQVSQLCRNWTAHRGRDDSYFGLLMNAVSGLADQVGSSTEDQSLTENPLMLTAICMVFERYRSLPDDRGRLCELLIDDLCRSRNSEDIERGWKLDDATKKDLLQRIALAMQEEGAQTWPVSQALEIATTLVPKGDKFTQLRAKKYLDWAADHTGLLRFQQDPQGEEHIRFWHRLFREYLAAARLAQLDKTASDMIDQLWNEKRLENPFWEDVIRLLPRPLGTKEKAGSLRQRLEDLAEENPLSKPRLLGLAAAGIIENRDLFPDVDFPAKAIQMCNIYLNEGDDWPIRDKLLFLEGLGRLDPDGGDPRFHQTNWIMVQGGDVRLQAHSFLERRQIHLKPKTITVAPFRIASTPVTVQEYQEFIEAIKNGELNSAILQQRDESRRSTTLEDRVRQQLRHPNWPIVLVSLAEAEAFCEWKTRQRTDDLIVRLPWESEIWAIRSIWPFEKLLIKEKPRYLHPTRPTYPVGCFQSPKAEIVDLWTALLQWCKFSPRGADRGINTTRGTGLVFGISDHQPFEYPPSSKNFVHEAIGFRCILAPQPEIESKRRRRKRA